jgi:hypothetical protein
MPADQHEVDEKQREETEKNLPKIISNQSKIRGKSKWIWFSFEISLYTFIFVMSIDFSTISHKPFENIETTLSWTIPIIVLAYLILFEGNLPFMQLVKHVEKEKRDLKTPDWLSLRNPLRYIHDNPNYYLNKLISDYRFKCSRLQSTAYIFLFFGLIIAFIGAAVSFSGVFSSGLINENLLDLKSTSLDTQRLLLYFGTRLTSLVFIEAVAFFLLQQFKSSLSEYRYYDRIKRHLEAHLLLIKTADLKQDDLLDKLQFYGHSSLDIHSEIVEPDLVKSIIDKIPSSPK